MTTLFISDLHIHAGQPEIGDQFLEFLEREAANAEQLYVLGDLFEAWIGDDYVDAEAERAIAGLRRVSDSGVSCFFMHGNRDFLIGQDFAAGAGLTLLTDPTVAEIHGQRVLLMHGDTLCTDDTKYQEFRTMVRDPRWQREMLALPVPQRLELAKKARLASQERTGSIREEIMDVNQDTVVLEMTGHKVSTLLHGHTHRPGVHEFDAAGSAMTRIVLGDWYTQGSVVRWDESGFRLETLARDA